MPRDIEHAAPATAHATAHAEASAEGSARAAVRWTLTRNLATTPRIFMLHMGAAAGGSCAIGIGFWIAGYPLVFGFCACQALALLSAMVHYTIHALDGEQLVLTGETLEVQCIRGFRSTTVRLNPCWTRLEFPAGSEPPTLCSGRTRVPVAVHLGAAQRRKFAEDFSRLLAGARTLDSAP